MSAVSRLEYIFEMAVWCEDDENDELFNESTTTLIRELIDRGQLYIPKSSMLNERLSECVYGGLVSKKLFDNHEYQYVLTELGEEYVNVIKL